MIDIVVSLAITGPMSESDLKAYSEDIKRRLKMKSEISQVTIQGFPTHQIRIQVPAHTLMQYGLSLTDIADTIMDGLKPSGVAVIVQAEHMCMIMRGVKKPGSNIITSAIRGAFRTHPESRAEFFSLVQGK